MTTETVAAATTADPVTVSLADLRTETIPFDTLLSAFGPNSLGILLVRDLPPEFPALRSKVLSDASRLAHLPLETLDGLTNAKAKYLVGWSHGKEMLRDGVVDKGKGSFYMNCSEFGQDKSRDGKARGEEDNRWRDFDEYSAPNIWPDETAMPGFRDSAEELITMIIDVAILVARACDKYAIETVEGYQPGCLEEVVRTSQTTKARLLHYFPAQDGGNGGQSARHDPSEEKSEAEEAEDWCTTHLDHGCLTGLTSAMYLDEHPSQPEPGPELAQAPTPTTGLYITSRTGTATKITIPRTHLAFQTGEALQLMTRDRFKAVPHFVKAVVGPPRRQGEEEKTKMKEQEAEAEMGSRTKTKIARNTLAVFTQPDLDRVVDGETGLTFGSFAARVVGRNTSATM